MIFYLEVTLDLMILPMTQRTSRKSVTDFVAIKTGFTLAIREVLH